MDLSLTDWDVKEQEGLMEVEKILDRADEILEKEENVLAQEAVLDALLRSEDHQWPLWAGDSQLSVMSSSELAEAGVLGLEDYLDPAESDHLSEPRPGSASETKASEDDGVCTEAAVGAFHSRSDLLMELRKVHVLDELIMEENLKIQELRSCKEEELSVVKPQDTNGTPSMSKGREAFRLQLEKEKREVEKLERSLDSERNMKKLTYRRVVTCSIMEKARGENKEDQALCNELLSGNRSTSLVQNVSQDSCKTEHVQAVLDPDVAPQDLVLLPDSQYQDDCSGAEPPVFNLVTLNSSCDLKEAPEEEEPRGCIYGENASLTAETRPDDSAFDPGGISHRRPVPKPRKTSLPVKNNLTEHEPPHSSELLNPALSSGDQDVGFVQLDGRDEPPPENVTPIISHDVVLSLHVKEQSNNNNNHTLPEECSGSLQHLEITTECGEDPSCLPQTDSQAADQLPPDQPLEFDPGGEDEQDKDLMPDGGQNSESMRMSDSGSAGVQSSESMKISGSGSAGVQSSESMRMSDSGSAGVQSSESMRMSDSGSAGVQSSESMRMSDSGSAGVQRSESTRISGPGSAGVQSSESTRISGSGSAGVQTQLNINMREMTDFKTPIVLDTGSGLMKAGFADRDLPNVVFPTIIGMPKYEEIMNGNLERETYIGHGAQHMRGVLALKHPIKNGIICNWDEMEKIWHHTFQQLCVDPDDHPVLLTEAAMNPLENRRRMVEIMFECFGVPLTYVAMQAVLALYASGRSTGVVFDSGDGVSHSVPVFEGYCLPHSVQRFPLAGLDVTMHLKKLLQEQGVNMRSTAELEIVREMKERCCCVALNYEAELSQGEASCREMHYTMPDGQIVTLSTERFRAPEILFKPELIGQDHYGIHESVFKSILSSDMDLRSCFLGNIVLSGGNTLLSGFPERLQAEIKGLVPANMGESVRVSSPKDRVFSVWSGGAVLASLPSFSSAWISQEEYEECGPHIVYRKCF